MFRFTLFLIVLVVFSSCKTQYAYFQESSYPHAEVKEAKKLVEKIEPLKTQNMKIEPVSKSLKTQEIKFEKIFIPILIAPEQEVHQQQGGALSFEHPDQKFFQPKLKEDPKLKKKRKKFRKVSSNIFIGFTFLGIAILLAILKVPTLVILFGIASIVFLVIGLKKIWKKKRRRSRFENIFKRKR